jgi:hypothetical protein
MTVRLTPTESDNNPPPQVLLSPEPCDVTVTPPAADPPGAPSEDASTDETADLPDGPPAAGQGCTGPGGGDSRITLREARRQRRRVAWLCVAVVVISLGLTIVVVSLARSRPAPSAGVVAPSSITALVVPSTPTLGSTSPPSYPHPGAPAPEGGKP